LISSRVNIFLRPGVPSDAETLIRLHHMAVHQMASAYYPREVLDVWSPHPKENRQERLRSELKDDRITTVVAEVNAQIAGFGMVVPAGSELRAVYVHPEFGRRGVGSAILGHLEQGAVAKRVLRLDLDASVNSEAFYARHGYEVVERTVHRFQSGHEIHEMACVRMSKALIQTTAPIEIREETNADEDAIRDVLTSAFPRDAEARLVDLLRQRQKASIALVAVVGKRIVGHILFSPVTVAHAPQGFRGSGLAPVAVHRDFQNRGIGSTLICEGLERCRHRGYDAVVVLGHPNYYPRFGFRIASAHDLGNEYGVDKAFMVLGLKDGILEKIKGLVKYAPEFREVDC
jgi:putative acetyltransferase